MSYQQYEKLLGETFFEANLKAENKHGKGNFEVLTSKRVKHPIYFGLGTQELVELTIGILDHKTISRAVPKAPSRPLPSVEISVPTRSAVACERKPQLRQPAVARSLDVAGATSDDREVSLYTPGFRLTLPKNQLIMHEKCMGCGQSRKEAEIRAHKKSTTPAWNLIKFKTSWQKSWRSKTSASDAKKFCPDRQKRDRQPRIILRLNQILPPMK